MTSQSSNTDNSLFAMDRWTETPLPDGTVMIRNPRNGQQVVVPGEVANAMSYCSRFASLEEHVAGFFNGGEIDEQRAKGIRSVLQSLQKKGMTISADSILERLVSEDQAMSIPAKPILTVITWHRPLPLDRLLQSLLKNCDPSGIDHCIVIDDSRDADMIRQNQAVTSKWNARSSFRIEYFGKSESAHFLGRLIDAVPEHEASVRFMLDRERWADLWTCGLSRNTSQILSVGYPLIVFDDDVVVDVHEAPHQLPGVCLSDYPRQADFFEDKAQWPPPAEEGSRDPIARHMRCLGLTVADAIKILGLDPVDDSSLNGAENVLADRYRGDSRVLITECGSLGDPGTGHNQWLTRLSPESRERLLQNRETFDRAMTDRNNWMGRKQFSFTPAANMSQITGTDNRDFLPPYFPFNRVEDRLFGQTTSFVFPHSFSLDQPWATPHLPMPARHWGPRDNDYSLSTRFPGDLMYLPSDLDASCPYDQPLKRLGYLARHYRNLANCPDHQLVQGFSDDWNQKRAAKLMELHRNIEEADDAPEFWTQYLHRAMAQVTNSTLGNQTPDTIHSEFPRLDGKPALGFWRDTWRDYAQALEAWPDIRKAARAVMAKARQS